MYYHVHTIRHMNYYYTKISPEDTRDLNVFISKWYPDAMILAISFTDTCGCFSEVTQEPCYLGVEIVSDESFFYKEAQVGIANWAQGRLKWKGCDCCENELAVDLRVFNKVTDERETNVTALEPYARNSTLLQGQEAADFIIAVIENSIDVAIIAHITDWKRNRRIFFTKMDNYSKRDGKLHVSLQKVGEVPLLIDEDIPFTGDVIEGIEVRQSQQPLLIFNDSKEPYKSEGACLKWIRQVPG